MLVTLRPSDVFKTVLPSKMFEAMAAAGPIVLGVEGEARDTLLEAGAGIAVPPGDAAALADAVCDWRAIRRCARRWASREWRSFDASSAVASGPRATSTVLEAISEARPEPVESRQTVDRADDLRMNTASGSSCQRSPRRSLAFALTPLTARLAVLVGAIDVPGRRKMHAEPIPGWVAWRW